MYRNLLHHPFAPAAHPRTPIKERIVPEIGLMHQKMMSLALAQNTTAWHQTTYITTRRTPFSKIALTPRPARVLDDRAEPHVQ
jgi:hypothetical protein